MDDLACRRVTNVETALSAHTTNVTRGREPRSAPGRRHHGRHPRARGDLVDKEQVLMRIENTVGRSRTTTTCTAAI